MVLRTGVLPGEFKVQVGNGIETWKDVTVRNCLCDLNLSEVLLLDLVLVMVCP